MQKSDNYNPDVLTCLANLSSDEVFTPPQLANQILDLLPKEIWSDKSARFLDPVCKSGVFLREIAKRLNAGLEKGIPNKQKRINHIFKNQLFGIAITELTALFSRRSVYCSKKANGKYSVCESFNDLQGNIRFKRIEHKWESGRCMFCGASREVYDRGGELETHAYQFIHIEKPEEVFNMKFDVIIGNPPYQLSTGGSQAQATPLYDKFVTQAKKLNPRYLTMVIPARWYTGGFGLNSFRDEMLNDSRIRKLVDFPISADCFPGVQIKGGVCYFLWDRDNKGQCEVVTVKSGEIISKLERPLMEKRSDIFLRFNESVSIYRKVTAFKEEAFDKIVSSQKPFGFATNYKPNNNPSKNRIRFYGNKAIGYVERREVTKNSSWIDSFKILISAGYGAGEDFPHQIINKPFIVEPESCCSETYIVIGPFDRKKMAEQVVKYISTKFFRFLVLLQKNSQHALKKVYSFVPIQNFNEAWTDEKLYKKYGLTKKEIAFIESMIRPME